MDTSAALVLEAPLWEQIVLTALAIGAVCGSTVVIAYCGTWAVQAIRERRVRRSRIAHLNQELAEAEAELEQTRALLQGTYLTLYRLDPALFQRLLRSESPPATTS
ncbi:hypothetical protein [Leucobacter aridicollis]|uniref:hypothetical protein n=1 Tax=Leucobacter aridicollis TaxID=283878 RepID=UPI00216A299A|nr:hypothetical protein [Leucobacter aridicollis]MCS3427104.1 hypothetical protein [Leucobacter aridicollis]